MKYINNIIKTRLGKTFVKIFLVFLSVYAVYFCSLLFYIISSQGSVPENGKDAVIVLGCGLKGYDVSLTLARRLDRALTYINENPQAVIVVAGAQGSNEKVPEAYAMKNYLVAKGVDDKKIIMEDRSRNTRENFLFSKKILDELLGEGAYSVTFVTSDFHVPRSAYLAEKAGLDAEGMASKTLYYAAPVQYGRESLSYIKLLLQETLFKP